MTEEPKTKEKLRTKEKPKREEPRHITPQEKPKPKEEENQVAVITSDGFDDNDGDDRLIQGTIAKCVDGHWSTKDGTAIPPERQLLALSTALAIQRWHDQKPVETIIKRGNKSLPDIDELNEQIPKAEWEAGFDGTPRAPWVRQHIVYLLDPRDASVFTFINSTSGAAIAVDRLKDRVRWMRTMRGDKVVPLVTLDAKMMKTRFGQKMRPEFTIIEWRNFGEVQTATTVPALEYAGQPVTEPTLAEEMNDDIPSFSDDED